MILKEYLVTLGFRLDQSSLGRFNDGVTRAEKSVLKIGEAAVGAAGAIEAMVAKISEQQNELFYLSQRTGASVKQLQAYEFAAERIGLSADAARSSVEGFAMAMRNPGLAALAAGFGVTPGGGGAKGLHQFVGRVRHMPDFLAFQFAGMFGLDAHTYLQLKNNYDKEERQEEAATRRRERAGVATDDITRKFVRYSDSVGTLADQFYVLEQRIAADFVGPATTVNELLTRWAASFSETSESVRNLELSVTALSLAFGKMSIPVGVFAALEVIRGREQKISAGQTGEVDRDAISKMPWYRRAAIGAFEFFGGDVRQFASTTDQNGMNYWHRQGYQPIGGPSRGDRNNNPGNMEYGPLAQRYGATGTDGRFAIFPTKEAGEGAMSALLDKNYGGLSLREIQRKWVGNGDNVYLNNLARHTGLDPDAIPDIHNPDVRRKLMEGIAQGEGTHLGQPWLSQPTLSWPQSSGEVNLHQSTQININGSGDPAATASAVANRQDRINSDLVRSAGTQLQ